MILLSEEQRESLENEIPPMAVDPKTRETYVLIRSAVYDRIRHFVEDDTGLSKRELACLVEGAMKEYDANDPSLHLYQDD